ncbi:hypothetical protein [Luteolibacter marinus]|uniref:hypothetical protein n=1 Tax=Luteolibacter marinus TaxID=2776705 RepID=UPI001865FBAD|nr:hypothetical protein [Luteolibacter marinus]
MDCPFNPFSPGNYRDVFLGLESKVIHQLSRKLAADLSPSQAREMADAIGDDDLFTSHALHVWLVHGSGRLEQWREQGFFRDWKNDEQVLLGWMASMRPALIEFREGIDGSRTMAVDLLRPELPPFAVTDEAAASQVGRFQVQLGWLYDLPAGQRLSGGSIAVPSIDGLEPQEVLDALLDHLDAPAENRTSWLLEHMTLVADAFVAIGVASQVKQLAMSDLRQFTLNYPVPAGILSDLESKLRDSKRVFVEETDSPLQRFLGSLLDEGSDRDRDHQARVLGELQLTDEGLEFQAIGETAMVAGRQFIAELGLELGAEERSSMDLAPSGAPSGFDPDLVPPRFLDGVSPLDLSTMIELQEPGDPPGPELPAHYLRFADTALPAFGGRTPREAGGEPSLRPRLVRLMKEHVARCDQQRRADGIDIDLNPLLADLGLDELILPPPPIGFIEVEDEGELPLDPPPRQGLLEGEQLEIRIQMVTGDEAMWNRLEIRLADILDAFNDLSDQISPHELELLQTTALAILGAFHPDQVPGYDPDAERMVARYESWMASGDAEETLEEYLDRIFAETRQQQLCEAAVDLLFHLEDRSGKKIRKKKLDALITALAAAIWEAAHWPPLLD